MPPWGEDAQSLQCTREKLPVSPQMMQAFTVPDVPTSSVQMCLTIMSMSGVVSLAVQSPRLRLTQATAADNLWSSVSSFQSASASIVICALYFQRSTWKRSSWSTWKRSSLNPSSWAAFAGLVSSTGVQEPIALPCVKQWHIKTYSLYGHRGRTCRPCRLVGPYSMLPIPSETPNMRCIGANIDRY